MPTGDRVQPEGVADIPFHLQDPRLQLHHPGHQGHARGEGRAVQHQPA